MNITPVFLEEKIYGTFDVINNQSEGLIKLFHHKKIDLAINPMRLSMDRSYVVDIVVIGSDEVKGSTLRNISMMNPPKVVPQTNRIWPGLTEFGPPMWQAKAVTVSSLSALPAIAMGQILLVYSSPL